MNLPVCSALTAILLSCPLVVLADEAADTFNKLYADDLKRVAATPSPADDVALARQLLEAAGKVANQKALLTLLCEKAYELAIKDPAGYPTAKAAKELLAAGAAEKKVESTQAEKQIAALKARLAADPKDASSRKEIVRLYLVEMDNPAEAAKFLDEAMDAATRKYVPAAAKPIEEAPEAACTEMGDWYKGLADQATAPASKGAMLERAKAYYTRFADLHKADDVARAGATLMLMKIDDALAKLGPAAVGMPGSSSLTLDLGKGATMKLVLIRPGKFMMGSPDSEEGRASNEGPRHEVTISKPFYMGATEVTQAQYEAVMGTNPSIKFKGPTNPVVSVSWEDAGEFCRKLSEKTRRAVRLPTEAEWEYACRAGTKTRFSFGDSDSALGDYAWCGRNSGGKAHPVGQKKPNPWGLYDMHGNVWEWCADWYGSYSSEASTDPQGAGSGGTRVARGGALDFDDSGVFRCAYRFSRDFAPTARSYYRGFRVVVSVSAAAEAPRIQAKATFQPQPPGAKELALDLGNAVKMKLALIPAGKFMMGSPDSEQGRDSKEGPQRVGNEGPQHEVTITKPFYMGVTEVTQAQYEAVMGTNPSKFKGPTNPVEMVSWHEAVEFCRKLSEKTGKAVRLPTEAEREYACRAGTKTRFSFGDSDIALGDYAWYASNSGGKTQPVGRKKPNAWGLYDMHGNVGEWCADWYGSYSIKASTDPQGAASGDSRVSRGLSWVVVGPDRFRCAYRYSFDPSRRYNFNGFRCAMTP